MNDDAQDGFDEAPVGARKRTRAADFAALCISLVALLVALHCRLFPQWGVVDGRSPSVESLDERLDQMEQWLRELDAELGNKDAAGRTIGDRLLLAENKNLLLDETLGKIVAHVKSLEDTLGIAASAR
jgi:hypothetical protein